jgi:hypothetical protein
MRGSCNGSLGAHGARRWLRSRSTHSAARHCRRTTGFRPPFSSGTVHLCSAGHAASRLFSCTDTPEINVAPHVYIPQTAVPRHVPHPRLTFVLQVVYQLQTAVVPPLRNLNAPGYNVKCFGRDHSETRQCRSLLDRRRKGPWFS